jgi:hypothetical protein
MRRAATSRRGRGSSVLCRSGTPLRARLGNRRQRRGARPMICPFPDGEARHGHCCWGDMLRVRRPARSLSIWLLTALSTFVVASAIPAPARAGELAPATPDAATPTPEPARIEPSSPARLRLGLSPAEYGSRGLQGGDGYSFEGGRTYGLDAQFLYAVGSVVELGVGGAYDHTTRATFSPGAFDAVRTFATARFHADLGRRAEIGIAPRFGYALAWADTYASPQTPSYRRSFRGLDLSLAIDARAWLTPRIALFFEIEARAVLAGATSADATQGYYSNPSYQGFGVAPTVGAIVTL